MLTADGRSALERFVSVRGGDLSSIDAATAVDVMISWYESERVDDVVGFEDGGDMLLFQWGTDDVWGKGPTFKYNLTRQFIRADEEGDDAIWQLSVTLHYPPNDQTEALGMNHRWCPHPAAANAFRTSIEAAEATVLACRTTPSRVEIWFALAG